MNTTSLSFFYSAQSGNPYTVIYASGGNPFCNSANANLPYIPKDQADAHLMDKKDAQEILLTAPMTNGMI